ncbi:MAG: nuclear transport factor 2 family protein [Alphaproteobacteria bacterium]|nr:nuclear transport factor 2 family protein [Alphaproteobacteria bacterium]
MTSSMDERLARLEAIEEIKALKARYCALCDADYDPDGLAALFLPDGIWDGGPFGRHEGRAAIRAFFKGISGTIRFAAHLVLNPIIEVQSADRATGKWRLIMPCTVTGDDGATEARWLLSAYDEEYARHEGAWLFRTLHLTVNFYAPHLKGWA